MNISLQYFEEMTKKCKDGKKKEKFKLKLERCLEVYENISIIEMEMLWYIRHSKKYNSYSYLVIAKKIYEAEQGILELLDAPNNIDVDKK